jgi:hypothetical protein
MTINKCTIDGCEKPRRRNGEKTVYCHMHYRRFLKNGNAGNAKAYKVYSYGTSLCSVPSCDNLAKKKGFCINHYDSQRNTSLSAEKIDIMKKNGCEVCGSFSRLTLDHDHSCCPTNKSCDNCVRGILCHKCNTAAGLLDDDTERMISLASYIISKKRVLEYGNK